LRGTSDTVLSVIADGVEGFGSRDRTTREAKDEGRRKKDAARGGSGDQEGGREGREEGEGGETRRRGGEKQRAAEGGGGEGWEGRGDAERVTDPRYQTGTR
jgi:hypothetical protein